MAVTSLTKDDVRIGTLLSLGIFDEGLHASSTEVISESLRHVASLRAPLTASRLRRAVFEALCPIVADPSVLRDAVSDQLDLLLANGDLEEVQTTDDGTPRTLLYLAPPAFVEHGDSILLLGVKPDAEPLIGDINPDEVERIGHLRVVKANDLDATRATLQNYGLVKLPLESWLRQPSKTEPSALLDALRTHLEASTPVSAGVADVSLIDPNAPTSYYRGRWRLPGPDDSGIFVGRRRRKYGADSWCALSTKDGVVTRSLELPTRVGIEHARDEAWLTQLAIDAERGDPQRFRIEPSANPGIATVDLFGPVPTWGQRRLSVFGKPIDRTKGALISFEIATTAVPDLSEFLTIHLWMHADDGR